MKHSPKKTRDSGQSGILKQLAQLGLNERESHVYLTLVKIGSARATELAKASKEQRTHLYQVLSSLEQKGLITSMESNNILRFTARHPSALLSLIQQRMTELENVQDTIKDLIPLIASMQGDKKGKPVVEVSHGEEAMKLAYREVLSKPFISVFNPKQNYEKFPGGTVQWVFGSNKRPLQGRELVIQNEATAGFMQRSSQTKSYRYKLLPKGIELEMDIVVTGDTTVLFLYDEDSTVIRIDCAQLASPLKALFDMAWGMMPELK